MRKTNNNRESFNDPLQAPAKRKANNNIQESHDFKNVGGFKRSNTSKNNPTFSRSMIFDNGFNSFKADNDVNTRCSMTGTMSAKKAPFSSQSERGIPAGRDKTDEPKDNNFPGMFKKKQDPADYKKSDL